MKKMSVIIVNWNTGDLLKKCVHSLWAEKERYGSEIEILVLDNASSDDSIEVARRDFPDLRYIENAENLGFARATNQGIRISTGSLVLLLNPDTEVIPGALDVLERFLDSQPRAGAVGPRLLNPDGSIQISAYPEPTLSREAWRLFHLDKLWPVGSYPMSRWRIDTPREVDVLMGACILLRREVLDRCGLLDERYFIYSEDQDLCRRLRSNGWRIFWQPVARVIHYGGRSTRQVKAEMFVRLYGEKIAYFRRHHGGASAIIYKLVLLCASLIRQLISPVALLVGRKRRSRVLEMARLYRRLVRELPGL